MSVETGRPSPPRARLSVEGAVATVTLAGPGKVATLDAELARDLRDAVRAAEDAPDVQVLVLRGENGGFCLGADLRALEASVDEGPEALVMTSGPMFAEVVRTLGGGRLLTVAAVDGLLLGGGLALALACDVVLAAEGCRIGVGYGAIATTPDLGVSHHLVRDLGYRRALWLYLTSETLTAADARSEGLVTAVVPDADLHVRAAEVAGRLADGPIETFRDGRALLRDAAQTPLAAQMEREFHVLVGALRRPSFRTAAAALRASLRPSGQETTP